MANDRLLFAGTTTIECSFFLDMCGNQIWKFGCGKIWAISQQMIVWIIFFFFSTKSFEAKIINERRKYQNVMQTFIKLSKFIEWISRVLFQVNCLKVSIARLRRQKKNYLIIYYGRTCENQAREKLDFLKKIICIRGLEANG